jgi:Ser/Thr protein kinase RdoA (MazF antagonist)
MSSGNMATDILNILNEKYPAHFDNIEQLRDGGSVSYIVFSGRNKYFLRATKSVFFDTAMQGADIQIYLQGKGFPVPPIVRTKIGSPYIKKDNSIYILYEFIEGTETNIEQDAEIVGALVGKLHHIMKDYPGKLAVRDERFFIGRYVDILKNRQYAKTEEFAVYGSALWDNIKDLPRGYCHGDMHSGNVLKTPTGKHYILDFDTFCEGVPMYDLALICDMTEYFEFKENNYERSNMVLSRFVPEYMKYHSISTAEIEAFHDLIAIQHFSTQATIMEMFGADCLSDVELDGQLDWLYRWRAQCGKKARI